jgi:hypothetical protein
LARKRLLVKLPDHDRNILARGLVIAALRSGSGKTMLTLGLMRSYRNAGLTVAGAKCGPDYIDPAFHAAATGKPSFNLDSWAMSPALLGGLAVAAGEACELILCEGVMGLFDGLAGEPGRTGSAGPACDRRQRTISNRGGDCPRLRQLRPAHTNRRGGPEPGG